MKAVILAGGRGTRISEESDLRPKPMVEIGGRPILWHIMKMYSNHGIKDFVICLGYKGYMIKEYFFNYYRHTSDFKINLATGDYEILNSDSEDWSITFVETGLDTETGGRIKRIQKYVEGETFCLTYGDGVSDIDIASEIEFHKLHGKLATVAAVKPPGRFAALSISDVGRVLEFREKPDDEVGLINGGFFVLEPGIFERLSSDSDVWEREPLKGLVEDGELAGFVHEGFWQPMDTLREQRILEQLSKDNSAIWLNPKNY
jgi:glucose-1-phosphate cytidylyltransferase